MSKFSFPPPGLQNHSPGGGLKRYTSLLQSANKAFVPTNINFEEKSYAL